MRARLSFPDNLTQLNREELLYALSSINWTEEDKQRITRELADREAELCDRRIRQAEDERAAVLATIAKLEEQTSTKDIRNKIASLRCKRDVITERIRRYKVRKEGLIDEFDI
jgi:uncharacterized coiled-coil DUF342 family protein